MVSEGTTSGRSHAKDPKDSKESGESLILSILGRVVFHRDPIQSAALVTTDGDRGKPRREALAIHWLSLFNGGGEIADS